MEGKTTGGPNCGILGEGEIRISYTYSEENTRHALGRMHAFLEQG